MFYYRLGRFFPILLLAAILNSSQALANKEPFRVKAAHIVKFVQKKWPLLATAYYMTFIVAPTVYLTFKFADIRETAGEMVEITGRMSEDMSEMIEITGEMSEISGKMVEITSRMSENTGEMVEITSRMSEAAGEMEETGKTLGHSPPKYQPDFHSSYYEGFAKKLVGQAIIYTEPDGNYNVDLVEGFEQREEMIKLLLKRDSEINLQQVLIAIPIDF